MSRKLVTVRSVTDTKPIAGADMIELAIIDGWQCVVKKGEFNKGDLGVYFEIDSFLPSSDKRFSFLEKHYINWNGHHGSRIRTIKLRGEISQGLLLPLRSFPEIEAAYLVDSMSKEDDFSETLGVVKWEREYVETNTSPKIPKKTRLGKWLDSIKSFLHNDKVSYVIGIFESKFPSWVSIQTPAPNPFPSFIPKTDEERIQNVFNSVKAQDEINPKKWEVSIKLDGSSMTVFHYKGQIGVCSRNVTLKLEDGGNFWNTALALGLPSTLHKYGKNIALQGELMGPGIQGNKEGLGPHSYYVYNVYDIDNKQYMAVEERNRVLRDLQEMADQANTSHTSTTTCTTLLQVPILDPSKSLADFTNIEELLAYAEGPSINSNKREGLVFKREDGLESFKVISNSYLLKHGD